MRTNLIVALLAGSSLVGIPMLVGCDRTESEKKVETKSPDGTKTVDQQKTTTNDNGDSKTTTEHKVTAP